MILTPGRFDIIARAMAVGYRAGAEGSGVGKMLRRMAIEIHPSYSTILSL
jgi:hypothetical protein